MRHLTLAFAVALPLAACDTTVSPADAGPDLAPAQVTFHKDIEPLLQKHCLNCHQPGSIAPFSLVTYADAKLRAPTMAEMTGSRRMPPWGAQETTECTPPFGWKNDLRLSDAEIALFAQWSAEGAPEGDPADAPPPWQPAKLELANKSVELQPSQPFTASGSQDQFRCFPLDPKLAQLAYVNGIFFIAGNASVVHHAVLFTDPNAESPAKVDSTGSYDCFGGPNVTNPSVVGVWAPGGQPIDLPSNIGTPVAPGTVFVLQIHYHPAGGNSAPDTTRVQLRYSTTRPDYVLVTTAVGNYSGPIGTNGDGLQPGPDDRTSTPEFRIPAGAAAHTETMQLTIGPGQNGQPLPEVRLYGLMPHMHLAGVDEKIDLVKKTSGADECLLQEPAWDFSWQRFYAYDAPIDQLPLVETGDVVRVRCTYDNSAANTQLMNAYTAAGKQITDIFLGEQTFDEMCLMLPQLLVRNPF